MHKILSQRENEYLISLKDYVTIMMILGAKYKENTYRQHIKNGVLENGVYENGVYGVWVNSAIYNAVFYPEKGCSKCREYKTTIDNIRKICTLEKED